MNHGNSKRLQKITAIGAVIYIGLFLSGCGDGEAEGQDVANRANTAGLNGAAFGVDVPAFKDLVLVYEVNYNVLARRDLIESYPIIRFENSSFTKDLTGLLAAGMSSSQMEYPLRWGLWRVGTDSLELQVGTNSFDETYAYNSSVNIPSDLALNDCFTSANFTYSPDSELGEVNTGASFNTFCFQANGIFNNERSSSALTAEVIATSASDTAGFYEIDGHVMRLTYGDGSVVHSLFGLYSVTGDPYFGISLGSTMFTK